ncbi:MAG: hypothetical protein HKN19_09965 [Halioglobus sp.]|nr:hypothetical protein [Halioglobus sp.]
MYRYSADNEIVYTPEDLILFRESPFASWMERLTQENPDHGIAPDTEPGTGASRSRSRAAWYGQTGARWRASPLGWEEFVTGVAVERQSVQERPRAGDFVALLKQEGKAVVSIGRHLAEAERRCATTRAMRAGAQYIADAQLALGPMACAVDLLIRCDGVSDLGSFIYVPCATGRGDSRHTTHHLCFAADLLKSLQGVQPPELLVMRPGENIVCLPARDHMQRFCELKYQFMTAQLAFRKHRMPDPAQSSHFGRWSHCARQILAQRESVREKNYVKPPLGDATGVATGARTDRLAGNTGEGLAVAMKRAIASVTPVQAAPDDLVDRDAPAQLRTASGAGQLSGALRYGRG